MRTRHEIFHQVNNRGAILPIRIEQYEGKPHMVAPVVFLAEGVHCGSNGPLYYPLSELETFVEAWNGVPVVVQHPQEGTANSPAVIDRQGVGRLFNVYLMNDRLKGEIWIDQNKCRERFPQILHYLETNQPLEVSTGLFTEDDGVAGTWNGEEYISTTRHYRPDHLALLPGGTGACSWADGCGVRLNQGQGEDIMAKYQPIITVNQEDLRERVDKVRRVVDSLDSPVAINYTLAIYEDSVVYAVEPGSQSTPGIGRKCYKRGYTMDAAGAVSLSNDIQEVVESRSFNPVSSLANNNSTEHSQSKDENNDEGGTVMAKNTKERADKVSALLATNAGFSENDRAMLEGLECSQFSNIEKLAARPVEVVAQNTAPTVIDTEEMLLAVVSPELKTKVEMGIAAHNESRAQAISTIKANAANPFTDDALNTKSLCELTALAKLAGASVQAPAAPQTSFAANAGDAPPATSGGDAVEPLAIPKMNWEQK